MQIIIYIGLLFLILITNYFDRSAIAYAIEPLKQTFHLSNAQFGEIGAAFGFGYLVTSLVGGVLADKLGAKRVLAIAAMAWSVTIFCFGLANSYWHFFILRVVLGLAEGATFPAVTKVIADWLSRAARARAAAFALAAVPFASVIGAPLVSFLILKFNWRIMFMVLGAMSFVLSLLWYFIYHDKQIITPQADKIEHKTSWRFMLTNPSILSNNYAFFVFGYLLFFALIWLPGYLEQTYHLVLKQVGWFLTLPWLVATVMLLSGGFLSDGLLRKTHSLRIARSHLIWICQLISALCFIPVLIGHSLWVAIIFISLALGFGLLPNAVFYALNIDLAKDCAATSLGLMISCFALSGILAPWLTGLLSHVSGSFNSAIILLVILTLTSAVGIFCFQHPDKNDLMN